MTPSKGSVLGIDIGSVSVGIVVMTPERKVTVAAYAFHHGDPASTLATLSTGIDMGTLGGVVATSGTPQHIRTDARYDDQVCCIQAARHHYPDVRALFNVGGEHFQLVRMGPGGNYHGARGSTSCAAGTGAFLDQQARRLVGARSRLARPNRCRISYRIGQDQTIEQADFHR